MEFQKGEPRFVHCVCHDIDNGNIKEFEWEKDKIFVEESLRDDLLMLQNVFEGMIISPHVYPLIYEHKSETKETSLRSLEFYKEVQKNHDLFNQMSENDKLYFLIGLRDLFIASTRHLLNEQETSLLQEMVNLVDKNGEESVLQKRINNLLVTPYPTYQNKAVRFVSCDNTSSLDECFIRNELGLIMVFVDPADLSFHNFENIINLDSLFKETTANSFSLKNFQKHPGYDIYTFDLDDKGSLLLSLDQYGLYTPPLNKLSRGGQRFIFSSENLSKSLTTCLKESIPDKELINDNFKFLNYVFRYNKFKPGDAKFSSHYDMPYHDPYKKHYSKYTLLLYLTPGTADSVLSLDNGKFKIDSIDCKGGISGIIFDQQYEHEGKSFISSDKIFLRSDLIFEYKDKEMNFDDQVCKQFNVACYMSKESVFNNELEKYATDLFDHVAMARQNILGVTENNFKLIYKKYKNAHFVTNGYDYWFKNSIDLLDAAVYLILDYFNCTYESSDHFNKLTYSKVLDLKVNDISEIFEFLNSCKDEKEEEEEYKEEANLKQKKENGKVEDLKTKFKNRETNNCCPHCYPVNFNPNYSERVVKIFGRYTELENDQITKRKEKANISVYDHEIEVNRNKISITDSHITFESKIPLINFAGCWSHSVKPWNYIRYDDKTQVCLTNIPAIPYKNFENGYHLKIELFNNSFIRRGTKVVQYPADIIPKLTGNRSTWSKPKYYDPFDEEEEVKEEEDIFSS